MMRETWTLHGGVAGAIASLQVLTLSEADGNTAPSTPQEPSETVQAEAARSA